MVFRDLGLNSPFMVPFVNGLPFPKMVEKAVPTLAWLGSAKNPLRETSTYPPKSCDFT